MAASPFQKDGNHGVAAFRKDYRTLSIDFEAEALTDCEYEIAYTDTELELTAGKGTATQGEKFTLNRTEK